MAERSSAGSFFFRQHSALDCQIFCKHIFDGRFNNAEFGREEGDSARRGPEMVLEEEWSTIPGVEQSNEEEQNGDPKSKCL